MVTTSEQAKHLLKTDGVRFVDAEPLIKPLKKEFNFGLARKLLERCHADAPTAQRVWARQQWALCTYKDEELHPSTRFAQALEILESLDLRDPQNHNAETLALGGAVYKRLWDYGAQIVHLYEALGFYRAAWVRNPRDDKAYGGVNAAYLLDVLASRARRAADRAHVEPTEAEQWAQQARALRQEMKEKLPGLVTAEERTTYWYRVTLAEVHFGLEEYAKARVVLAQAQTVKDSEWELQTTFKQLVAIARLRGVMPPVEGTDLGRWHPAWQALATLLGDGTEQALSCYRGKVGLALSGGGFRASLYHLGVLARLAEVDVLRGVEVLSTVSGGSIVGAHYYLALRRRLMTQRDDELKRGDYIALVREVQEQFLRGVQKNVRTRALANLGANLRMLFTSYGRSNRMGELYARYFYSQVPGEHGRMSDLVIHPRVRADDAGQQDKNDTTFKPKFSNWRRRAKVPILLLNTTSLNSGHNWHFTASWMGEPPGLMGSEVDLNARYRRLYYWQAPPELKDYPLGYAVAASACVPGLFEPLVIKGLYPDSTVRLVDGGVHDNQGVQGLLDESCTVILCSDASGQMEDLHSPSDGAIAVPLRSNSILMDRVREAQYQDLEARVNGHALEGLFFVHLKQGLSVESIDWVDCDDPTSKPEQKNTTEYGIDRDIQERLAELRTDLDSFTEVEANALMLSGYLVTESELKRLDAEHLKSGGIGSWGGFDIHVGRGTWTFLGLGSVMSNPRNNGGLRRSDLEKQLAAGAALFGKVWMLIPAFKGIALTLGLTLLGLSAYYVTANWNTPITVPSMTVGWLTMTVLLLAVGLVLPLAKLLNPQKAARSWLLKVLLATVGWLATNVHIVVFDRFFLKRGRLKRLLDLPEE